MKALTLAVVALAVFATAITNSPIATADATICPGSALVQICVVRGSRELVVEPVKPDTPMAVGELQEWGRDLSGGTSVHVACFIFFNGIGSCETLASLDFVYVRTINATVSVPELEPASIACPIGVYSATLTVKVLGTGVEDAPFFTADATCA